MTLFGICECASCCRRLSKTEAHRIAIAGKRTSGNGWRSVLKSRTRTARRRRYDEKSWLCPECYAATGARRNDRAILVGAIAAIGVVALIAGVFASGDRRQNPSAPTRRLHEGASLAVAVDSKPPSSVENLLSVSSRSSSPPDRAGQLMPDPFAQPFNVDLSDAGNAIAVQARLAELGYLQASADGRWGPKSRAALREFKRTNGLSADDEWDETTASQLFGADVIRASADRPQRMK